MKRAAIEIYKNIVGNAEYTFKKLNYPADELVVLCMHSTPCDHQHKFELILDFLLKHFTILDPNQIDEYYQGNLKNGPYLLFTFDDGLKNNLYAAQLLEKRGLRAMFFIVPEFIRSNDQKTFYIKNIRPITDPSFDKEPEDFVAMSFDDLRTLQSSGHIIGSHTSCHTLNRDMNKIQIENEIIQSKDAIMSELKIEPTSFCSINNTTVSVNSIAKKMIAENYRFHFTTFPGLNSTSKESQIIFRRNIEVNWPLGKIKFSLGQVDLARWSDEIRRFRAL